MGSALGLEEVLPPARQHLIRIKTMTFEIECIVTKDGVAKLLRIASPPRPTGGCSRPEGFLARTLSAGCRTVGQLSAPRLLVLY